MEGWDEVSTLLARAREMIIAAAPDEVTAAEGEAYLVRLLTGSLSDNFLGHLFTDGGLTRALPVKGGPNPDYLLSHAPVSASRSYRLTGNLNGSERVGVGLYAFDTDGVALERGYVAFDRHNTGSNGEFSLTLSGTAETGGTLVIPPECRVLLIRTLHRSGEPPARLVLSGAEGQQDLALPPGGSAAGLAMAGRMMLGGVEQFLVWSDVCSAHPNRLFVPPESMAAAVQGDPDTWYLLGYYHLAEDQWLEVTLPEGLEGYWSLHAYNHWGEALPGAGVHDLSATGDEENRIRIAIGPRLPGEATNRIDTLGRHRGILIFRAIPSRQVPADKTDRVPGAVVRLLNAH